MMNLSYHIENSICEISFYGPTRLADIKKAEQFVLPILDELPIDGVIINLDQLEELNSVTISIIVAIYKLFEDKQIKLALCQLSPKDQATINKILLNKYISTYLSKDYAIKALRKT